MDVGEMRMSNGQQSVHRPDGTWGPNSRERRCIRIADSEEIPERTRIACLGRATNRALTSMRPRFLEDESVSTSRPHSMWSSRRLRWCDVLGSCLRR